VLDNPILISGGLPAYPTCERREAPPHPGGRRGKKRAALPRPATVTYQPKHASFATSASAFRFTWLDLDRPLRQAVRRGPLSWQGSRLGRPGCSQPHRTVSHGPRGATEKFKAAVRSGKGSDAQTLGRYGVCRRHGPTGGTTTPTRGDGSRRCMPRTAGMISVPAVATNKIRIKMRSAMAPPFLPNPCSVATRLDVGTAGHDGRDGRTYDHRYQLGDEPAHKGVCELGSVCASRSSLS
jgi:hypothetical protein